MSFVAGVRMANRNNYDLIIAPNNSSSDAITAALISARNKISSYRKHRLPAFPHSPQRRKPRRFRHAAYRPLDILVDMGFELNELNHNLEFSVEEKEQSAAICSKFQGKAITIAFFRGARGKKLLKPEQWERILSIFEDTIDKKIEWVEILSPDIRHSLREDTRTFETPSMRVLGSVLLNFDAFICCDTGPLHLADAAGASCIGLYGHTNTKVYGLLGENCYMVEDISRVEVEQINQQLQLY